MLTQPPTLTVDDLPFDPRETVTLRLHGAWPTTTALTQLLRELEREQVPHRFIVQTGNRFVVGLLRDGWKRSEYDDLVTRIIAVARRNQHALEFVHVAGHAGDADNERADKLARGAIAK